MSSSIHQNLSKHTSIFGLKLWIVISICIILILSLILIITILFICSKRRNNGKTQTISGKRNVSSSFSIGKKLLSSRNGWDVEMSIGTTEKKMMYSDQMCGDGESKDDVWSTVVNTGSETGLVKRYTLEEIEAATNGFAEEYVIGSGNHGVVFHGLLMDSTRVAVKKLFSNRRGLKGFVNEAEAMWLIRHKNLVKLLGYCAEATYRMLVYEYIDNGNLKQWLHQCKNKFSPLTWNIRMKIIIGVAKGLAYLHEDTEPTVVHRNLKSSNILLDHQWNPKISDFGINSLLGPECNQATAPPTGMSGYIAPEHALTQALDEKSDVYSFGILIMEIVSGKTSTESTVNEIEEYLVDWIKLVVAEQNFDLILDPKLPDLPSIKELKRIVLVALRCVDFEVENRPKMSEVIHMLEPRDLLLSDEQVIKRQISRRNSSKERPSSSSLGLE